MSQGVVKVDMRGGGVRQLRVRHVLLGVDAFWAEQSSLPSTFKLGSAADLGVSTRLALDKVELRRLRAVSMNCGPAALVGWVWLCNWTRNSSFE